ncbi:MAG: hypothetical protein AAF680_00140 [Pseudomonadota bacterium]
MRNFQFPALILALLCSGTSFASDKTIADIKASFAERGLFEAIAEQLETHGLSREDADREVDLAATQFASCLFSKAKDYARKLELPVEDVVRSIHLTGLEIAQDKELSKIDPDRFKDSVEPCLLEFSLATGHGMPTQ